MSSIPEQIRESALDVLVTANTPGFVFRKLRSMPSLRSFSLSTELSDLAILLNSFLNKPARSLSEDAEVYALIVGLSFRSAKEAEPILTRIRDCDSGWVGVLAGLSLGATNTSRLIALPGQFTAPIPVSTRIARNTTETLSGRPTLIILESNYGKD